ncbi:MAG TPA: A/G-specific adenine glycosylase [Acidimicrobiales bacterium]|nr:A/G-specific adenine glycosylase [Acidimicrobiales bacterium]
MRAVRRSVLAFGEAHRRDLPWRSTRDPWHVLVSEVMLQQTQVARVVEPYNRFVARYPTPAACAADRPGEVVRQWAGLGYNRRAVRLHAAATAVVRRHGGFVPDDEPALVALPGVGPYTARAVLALAFERPVGLVETNVVRLLSRGVMGRRLGPAEAQRLADRLVPPADAWAFNQALYDIGSRHCTSRRPDCHPCPLRRHCAWAAGGWPAPDPAARRHAAPPFEGSDRQGRGRLVAALRAGPVPASHLGEVAGWPDDPARARRAADALVVEGLARHGPKGTIVLV